MARIGQLQGRGALWTLNAIAGMVPYNGVWNVTGQPAASVPCGLTAAGLPVGLQVVGGLYQDALVLRACHAFQRAVPTPVPPLARGA